MTTEIEFIKILVISALVGGLIWALIYWQRKS